jgi:hypothetical protein
LQRNALSWMLHREVHGGQQLAHPFIVKLVTSSGVPFYADQVGRCLNIACYSHMAVHSKCYECAV